MKAKQIFPDNIVLRGFYLCVSPDSSVWVPQAEIDAAVQLLLKLKVDYKQVTGQDYKAGCPPSENVVVHDNGPAADGADDEDTVNPWDVSTTNAKGVDYDKLIGKRQCEVCNILFFGFQMKHECQ